MLEALLFQICIIKLNVSHELEPWREQRSEMAPTDKVAQKSDSAEACPQRNNNGITRNESDT